MFLVMDVGNSTVHIGVAAGPEPAPGAPVILHDWRLWSQPDRTPDEWFALLKPLLHAAGIAVPDLAAVVIGSVVPQVTPWITEMCRTHLGHEPVQVSAAIDTGIAVRTVFPDRSGADRIANAVAARDLLGAPVIVADFGTATNFDVVDADGAFVGGAIAPGIRAMLETLNRSAAQLGEVVPRMAGRVGIGRDTESAIESGTIAGYVDLIEGTIGRIRRDLGTDAPVIGTGGMAHDVASATPLVTRVEPCLTLLGLRLIGLRQLAVPAGSGAFRGPTITRPRGS